MPRLLVLAPAELTRDPRARRQVAAARRRGLEVVGVCGQVSGESPLPLDGVEVVRVGRLGRVDAARYAAGLERDEPALVRELRGVFRLVRLAARTVRFTRAALALGPVDVVHANDFDTLAAAALVARRRNARVVYDAHELYSEFEADPPRIYRAVVSLLERVLARRAAAVVTVSDPLANDLRVRLSLHERPLVVLNAPELDAREPPSRADGPLRVVYTGGFGSGRPLADLLTALEHAPDVRLTAFVVQLDLDALRREVRRHAVADRVEIAAPVSPNRLIETLHPHDVGVVFDRPVTRNAELSLPNKVFEYLMAGLAVVAPRLEGMGTVLSETGAAALFAPGRPDELGAALQSLAHDRGRLDALRDRARTAARERFNAEAQEGVLAYAWALSGRGERAG